MLDSERLPDGDQLIVTDASVNRLDPEGNVKWSRSGDHSNYPVSVGPAGLYLSGPHQLRRLDPEDGSEMWSRVIGKPFKFLPFYPNSAQGPQGELYVATERGKALKLDPQTGEELAPFRLARTWLGRLNFIYPVRVGTASDGSVLIQQVFDLECREPDGSHRWSRKFPPGSHRALHCRGRWLVGDDDGGVTALCERTGRTLWSTRDFLPANGRDLGNNVTPGPPGVVYVHSCDQPLTALNEETGAVLATHGGFLPGRGVHNFAHYIPVLGDDGRLYVSRSDRRQIEVLDPLTLKRLETREGPGSAPRVLEGGAWLISGEGAGVMRVDPWQEPRLEETVEKPLALLEDREQSLLVGGVSLKKREPQG